MLKQNINIFRKSIFKQTEEEEDDLNQTADSQEYGEQLLLSDSDEDCRSDQDSDENDKLSTISSIASTGPSSINSSPYSTASESEDTDESEDDAKESQDETESD